MIYELAVVAEATIGDDKVASLNEMVSSVVAEFQGEILIQDDWGSRRMAQAAADGKDRARYLYFIYRAETACNQEMDRRLRINESVLKQLFVKLGEESETDKIVKRYRTPFSKKYNGSVTQSDEDSDDDMEEAMGQEDERRKFSRRKACWFTSKGITADWKDPATFNWLINEFGKISPARVSGISVKHQRYATSAIKRARQLGIVSYMSNRIAE